MDGMRFGGAESLSGVPSQEKNKFKGVWERVTELALESVYRDRELEKNPELLAKVNELLKDASFKIEATRFWEEQATSGKVANDPARQDAVWAAGVVLRIKEKIDN